MSKLLQSPQKFLKKRYLTYLGMLREGMVIQRTIPIISYQALLEIWMMLWISQKLLIPLVPRIPALSIALLRMQTKPRTSLSFSTLPIELTPRTGILWVLFFGMLRMPPRWLAW